MKTMFWMNRLLTVVLAFFLGSAAQAGTPVWTFQALTPTAITVSAGTTASVKYVVTNQSQVSHTLALRAATGITQVTNNNSNSPPTCANPFVLPYHQSCILELTISGSALQGSVTGGPVVCESNNPSECYQPNPADVLTITYTNQIQQYTITPSTDGNGSISPNTAQVVNGGANLTFTATPNANYNVYQWLVDGMNKQTGGSTYTLNNIQANHTVEVTFFSMNPLLAGTANGNVYSSNDNGTTWTPFATQPAGANSINSVFATNTTVYAGSDDGAVHYTTNNGTSWSQSSTVPDTSEVNAVFIDSNNAIYAGSVGGHVYISIDNGMNWIATTTTPSPTQAAVNSIYVTNSGNIYVGSADHNVYLSQNSGFSWTAINGAPDSSAIHNVYVANNTLYVNTANEYAYTSTSLTGSGSWTLFAQTVFTLFVNSNATSIYAGTQAGYLFALPTGNELGFVVLSPINSIYALG